MQSVSPNRRQSLALLPGAAWQRSRAAVTGAVVWSAVLVFLLTFAVARSTATAAWVTGIDVVPLIALGGAVLLAVLAVSPLPWGLGLGVGMLAGPVVAGFAAGPALQAAHFPALVSSGGISLGAVSAWQDRIVSGAAAQDPAVYLFLICWLMWVTGGWLSWCVLRWRRPMLGLIPGAAAFATNLLNFPVDQNGYTLTILVLTLGLLLWTNYTGSIANATRAHVKLTGDARWDFWESGLVAMAALIVLGIMLPPLSTVDRTVQIESSAFSNWALLQERLSHPGGFGSTGTGIGGTTGFSTVVQLGGSLTRTRDPVFTYTITGDFSAPRYFRGVNETQMASGAWRYPITVALKDRLPRNQIPSYAEDYKKLALAGFNVKMISPPIGNNDILFYPALLYKSDRDAVANETILPVSSSNGLLATVDRLSSAPPSTSSGRYNITVEYSTATMEDLQAAGTNYPDWINAYIGLPDTGYRSPQVIAKIRQLALDVTQQANAVTPYDKAVAIESYLRSNYTYSLTVHTPLGRDPLDYFLFDSKKGYCEYYASAMGDMLRSLGIPTRLVSGFGPGQFDSTINSYVVRGEDAHTWVESYFPSYGWIPFEPTADGTYQTVNRGATGANICLRDFGCPDPGGTTTPPGGLPVPPGRAGGNRDPGATGGGSARIAFRIPDAGTLTKISGVVLAIVLILFAAAARYLRPRSVMGVWKRTIALSQFAGAERREGETPLELSRRLGRQFPEASEPLRTLASGFVVSAYAPPDVAETARPSVLEAWANLRPMLLRRLLARLRPNRD
jgi:transglutaminase-like putative cysteine protease